MLVRQFDVGVLQNFAYLIGDKDSGVGALIDPSAEWERLEQEARDEGVRIGLVFNTHSHPDHIAGNGYYRARGAKIVAHESAPTRPEIPVRDGAVVDVGAFGVKILHTPGHRYDAVCLLAGKYLFTGDTLFVGECGRTDLPGSDPRVMHHTLLTLLRGLPDDLIVMPGHNYGPVPRRTLGEEKRLNYTLQPRSLDEFLAFMGSP